MKDIWKNSARLLSANVVAQAIGLLVYPILTRLYRPDDFGLFNLFLSIGGILVVCATAEYQNAIVLPRERKDGAALFHIGSLIACAVTGLVLLSLPFAQPIAALFKTPNLAQWYGLMPVYVLVMSLWVLLNYYLIRNKQFAWISGYQVSQSVLSSGAKIGMGFAPWSGGLIIGSVFAPLVSLLGVGWGVRKHCRDLFRFDWENCKQQAKRYANFPLFSLPRSLVNNLSGNLPVLLLTPFFSLTDIGFFGMAVTLGVRPISMVSSSLYQTFFQWSSERVNRKQSIQSFVLNFVGKTMVIAVPVFIGLYFILPWLTQWLLGDAWRTAGVYLQVMLPWLLLVFYGSTFSFVSDLFQQQRKAFIIEIVYLIARVVALVIGIVSHQFLWAIVAYSVGGCAVIIYQLVWYARLIQRYEKSLIPEGAE